jgi:hypothetical protein
VIGINPSHPEHVSVVAKRGGEGADDSNRAALREARFEVD